MFHLNVHKTIKKLLYDKWLKQQLLFFCYPEMNVVLGNIRYELHKCTGYEENF